MKDLLIVWGPPILLVFLFLAYAMIAESQKRKLRDTNKKLQKMLEEITVQLAEQQKTESAADKDKDPPKAKVIEEATTAQEQGNIKLEFMDG